MPVPKGRPMEPRQHPINCRCPICGGNMINIKGSRSDE